MSKFINQDPSLESLRELYDKDIAEPDLNIINVTGMTCVGVPMGSPEFVTAFVRSKAKILQQDVQKLRIVPDPLIHYALLRFCQHTSDGSSRDIVCNVPPATAPSQGSLTDSSDFIAALVVTFWAVREQSTCVIQLDEAEPCAAS